MAEEINWEKCNFQNFRSPVTVTLDWVIRHTVYKPNFIETGKKFLWLDELT